MKWTYFLLLDNQVLFAGVDVQAAHILFVFIISILLINFLVALLSTAVSEVRSFPGNGTDALVTGVCALYTVLFGLHAGGGHGGHRDAAAARVRRLHRGDASPGRLPLPPLASQEALLPATRGQENLHRCGENHRRNR